MEAVPFFIRELRNRDETVITRGNVNHSANFYFLLWGNWNLSCPIPFGVCGLTAGSIIRGVLLWFLVLYYVLKDWDDGISRPVALKEFVSCSAQSFRVLCSRSPMKG